MPIPQIGRVRAPELDGGRGWLNTDKPLSLSALKGKVVLLDFWTYGCINCIHIIPDLKRLEAKYPNQLVVIGVHSAKFLNEKETENIRRIVLRYELEHPIVNDADFAIWRAYGVNAWPTQILIDPEGYIFGHASGEGNYEAIDRAIGGLVTEFRKRGALNEQPLKLALERARVGDLPLAFPGKVLADGSSGRLFIADSNHNRIVVTDLSGKFIESIGTGVPGAADGTFAAATFHRPQGMALDGNNLYVADTENHLIRRVDLKEQTVATIAGTGKQATTVGYQEGAPAPTTALNSPWDLQLVGHSLYIAMAGPHQIWKLDLDSATVGTFAGTGREARLDGPREDAGFAQPSGIASDGKTLYVADSEANVIRAIDLAPGGGVRTLAGGDLFDFGDHDGSGDDVRLQHPLGLIAKADGHLLIADTYNHKLKELDPDTGAVKTLLGTGKPGQRDGSSASFYEPGGLAIANGMLYVADTNNHAIRVVDLKTRRTSTLRIMDLGPPNLASTDTTAETQLPNVQEVRLKPQSLRANSEAQMSIDVKLPDGYHLNPAAPQRYSLRIETGAESLSHAGSQVGKLANLPLQLSVRTLKPGTSVMRITLTIVYCREDNTGTCQIKTLVWRAPVQVVDVPSARTEITIAGSV